MSKPFILVDGSSYLFRAFHAMPSFSNSKGEPTGAIYGVTNMLRSLLAEHDPDNIAVVFDAKGKTFRDDLYDQYKANRPPIPEELVSQIAPIHDIVCAMGLPLLCIPGVEADDVMGTLATQSSKLGMNTVISTGDKDLAQLVDKHVALVNTMNNTYMDPEGVVEKFGVPPERIIDYLSLIGDSVDNIPGVPKVGPKTAVKWLNMYGSLDNIIAHADEFKGKVGDYLRDSLEQIPLSKQLVTIKRDVKLEQGPKQLKRTAPDTQALREIFSHFEFKTWLAEILKSESADSTSKDDTPTADYETVLTHKAFDKWLKRLTKAKLFAFDLETTSLDYMQAKIVGISFAVKPNQAAYVPVDHDYVDAPKQLTCDEVLAKLKPLLEDPKQSKLGQNLKYDMSVLANYRVSLKGIRFDSMLESYVLNSTASRHDMDSLALKYLGRHTIHYEDVAGKGAQQINFSEVPIEQASTYAAEDADVTLQLHETLWPRLKKFPGLTTIFDKIEMPLLPILSRMERQGVLIDVDMLRQQSDQLTKQLKKIEQTVYSEAGESFNISSPKQIQTILFEKLGLPVLAKTPKGQPSTAESVLQDLAQDYTLPSLILQHRSMNKLKSTYTDKLPEQVNAITGRVHTSYHQAVAATGRLSSSAPNLQNIPVRTKEGRRIRQAFIAAPGYCLVAADYSQIELRIMAHLSGDEGLMNAFSMGEDVHLATAAEVFGINKEKVSTEQRRSAKAINFGLIYGMSAFGLARQLGINRQLAQDYVDQYFSRYLGVKRYMDQTRERARELGYVETVFGRRLYLPEIKASNAQRRQYAERTAINAPMQGTAADIIKRAMIRVDDLLQTNDMDVRMIMQVHDELVFEVQVDIQAETVMMIKSSMMEAAQLKVPLVVDVGVGNNWDEAH